MDSSSGPWAATDRPPVSRRPRALGSILPAANGAAFLLATLYMLTSVAAQPISSPEAPAATSTTSTSTLPPSPTATQSQTPIPTMTRTSFACNTIFCGYSIYYYLVFFLVFFCLSIPCGLLVRRRANQLQREAAARREAERASYAGTQGYWELQRRDDGAEEPLPMYVAEDPWKAPNPDAGNGAPVDPPPPADAGGEQPGQSSSTVGADVPPPPADYSDMMRRPAGPSVAFPAPSVVSSGSPPVGRITVPDAPPPAYTG
ncbi:hypothetical protein DFJ74DRAFT_687547 [Hyaloraphidium curvatum]|nr:hypothetical protein DFJ74DRAFT_687547 [Hyaloraphidium curvatum]